MKKFLKNVATKIRQASKYTFANILIKSSFDWLKGYKLVLQANNLKLIILLKDLSLK